MPLDADVLCGDEMIRKDSRMKRASDRLGAFLLARPLPPTAFAGAGFAVLAAGAAYCLGYEALVSGRAALLRGLLWSSYAVLPWFLMFELIKRQEARRDRPMTWAALLGWLLATGLASLLLEHAADGLITGQPSAPVALQLLRRLPAIGAAALLILLRRVQQQLQPRKDQQPIPSVEELPALAAQVRWIWAADNYLELHLPGRVLMQRLTMRRAESILAPHGFVRIHRSVIVNRVFVRSLVTDKGRPGVRMECGRLLPVGRAYNANLRQLA